MSFGPSHDPYAKYGIISERPVDPYAEYGMMEVSPEVSGKAQAFLDFFIDSMGRGDAVAQQFPLSQDEFRDIVGARIDARGPSVQERLRQLGATSFRDAINKGILPPPPRLPGV